MTPREFCESGKGEAVKAGVHGALGLIAGACLVYNVSAWLYRRKLHLARNVVIYGAIVGLELVQVRHHLR